MDGLIPGKHLQSPHSWLFYVAVLFITVFNCSLNLGVQGGGLSSLFSVFLLQSSASSILLFSVFSEDFHSTIMYCFIILYIKQLYYFVCETASLQSSLSSLKAISSLQCSHLMETRFHTSFRVFWEVSWCFIPHRLLSICLICSMLGFSCFPTLKLPKTQSDLVFPSRCSLYSSLHPLAATWGGDKPLPR